jgi:hypothetical protein
VEDAPIKVDLTQLAVEIEGGAIELCAFWHRTWADGFGHDKRTSGENIKVPRHLRGNLFFEQAVVGVQWLDLVVDSASVL